MQQYVEIVCQISLIFSPKLECSKLS